MAELRIGRGWSERELALRLERILERPLNFSADPEEMTPDRGWNLYHSKALIAREPPGPPLPGGPYRLVEEAVVNFHFSDPAIVIAHFDASEELLGRRMLLEMKALRIFRYLAGVAVGAVRRTTEDDQHTFGYRYDTLEGHIERGSEWFLLTKDLASGEIRFRIEASWRTGDFPNWWSRLGFTFLGPHYQEEWHRNAHQRLFQIAHRAMAAAPLVDELGVAHAGPNVVFERTPSHPSIPEPRWDEEETISSS